MRGLALKVLTGDELEHRKQLTSGKAVVWGVARAVKSEDLRLSSGPNTSQLCDPEKVT